MRTITPIKKMALASLLTAVSIVIDVVIKYFISSDVFGLPFYAIPLIIGGYLLGPWYGIAMGFISDTVGFFLMPSGNYIPFFALSAIFWAVIPRLISKINSSRPVLMTSIFLTHVAATLANTFVLIFYGYTKYFMPLRFVFIPINVILLTEIIILMRKRILQLAEEL